MLSSFTHFRFFTCRTRLNLRPTLGCRLLQIMRPKVWLQWFRKWPYSISGKSLWQGGKNQIIMHILLAIIMVCPNHFEAFNGFPVPIMDYNTFDDLPSTRLAKICIWCKPSTKYNTQLMHNSKHNSLISSLLIKIVKEQSYIQSHSYIHSMTMVKHTKNNYEY